MSNPDLSPTSVVIHLARESARLRSLTWSKSTLPGVRRALTHRRTARMLRTTMTTQQAGLPHMKRSSLPYLGRSMARHFGVELSRARASSSLLPLHLYQLFKQRDINIVLDVGARHGEFGTLLRRNGYRGRIVSFEPVASNYTILREASVQDPLWTSMHLALGSKDGAADINVTHGSMFSSFFPPNDYSLTTFGALPSVALTESVPVKKLDTLFDNLIAETPDPHVYLKMDTQGFDLEVLKGASGCLDRIVGMQSEVAVRKIYDDAPSMFESIDAILGYGFLISGMFPVTLDNELRVIEFDCVAVR